MNTNKNKRLIDHSRFNRWVHNLDEKDMNLNPLERKSKWILIVACIFVLFAFSFLVFPPAGLKTQSLETSGLKPEIEARPSATQSAFELPVDSFKNHIKRIIHEADIEKK